MRKPFSALIFILSFAVVVTACDDDRNSNFGKPMTRADHTPFFPIVEGAHGGMECLSCHGERESFQDFTCLSCHDHDEEPTNAIHTGLDGYLFKSASCYGCHPTGEGGVDHAQFFPIAPQTSHGEVGCGQCHAQLRPGGFAENNCASCHLTNLDDDLGAQHQLVVEFDVGAAAVSSTDCKRCHAESQVEAVADHVPFLIRTPDSLDAPHATEKCLDCHTTSRDDKAWATDFSARQCLSCHLEPDMNLTHGPLPAYEYNTPSCVTCHPDGSRNVDVDHEETFPIAPSTAHGEVSCADCHTLGSSSENACRSCHLDDRGEDLPALHAEVGEYRSDQPAVDSNGCKRCHAESQVDRVQDHGTFVIAGDVAHNRQNCLECHVDNRVDKLWAANFEQQTCLTCHAEPETLTDHNGVADFSFDTPSCLSCHPDGGPATDIEHSGFFPIDDASEHAGIGCGACHASTADRAQTLCLECHTTTEGQDLPALHSLVGEFANGATVTSTDCKACHAEAQVDAVSAHGPFGIQASDPHFQENCLECHADSRADKLWAADFDQNTCTDCHLAAETTPQHNGVSGYEFNTVSCLQCHPDGTRAAIDHDPIFPLGPGSSHSEISCSECHLSTTDNAINGCQECHLTESNIPSDHSAVRAPGNNWTNVDSVGCKACHADSQVDTVASHTPFRITNEEHRRTCASCHDSTRNDKPWGIDFEPFSCAECHSRNEMDDKHNGEDEYDYNDHLTCLICHPDGQKE